MEKWDNNIEEILGYATVQDYLCDTFSIRRLQAAAGAPAAEFVNKINSSRLYNRFHEELKSVAALVPTALAQELTKIPPEAAAPVAVNQALFTIISRLFRQNEELFTRHADKNISAVFNTDVAWLWQRPEVDLEAFVSLTDYIKRNYAGRDLAGAACVTAPVITPSRAQSVYQAFAGEINTLNLYEQFKDSVQTADNLIFKLVNAAVHQIHRQLYAQYSTDLIQHPEKPVIDLKSNSVSKARAAGREAA